MKRRSVRRIGRERRGTEDAPERGKGNTVVEHESEVEFDVSPCVQPRGVDETQAKPVEKQAPGGRALDGLCHREPPKRIERLRPGRDHEGDWSRTGGERRGDGGLKALNLFGRVEPEQVDER